MMYLILAEMDYSFFPKDPEEQMKIMARNMEMVKKDLDSGELSMFGMSPDGRTGFLISNQDAKTIYTKTQIIGPAMKFKIKPMLSFDELTDVMKEMQP